LFFSFSLEHHYSQWCRSLCRHFAAIELTLGCRGVSWLLGFENSFSLILIKGKGSVEILLSPHEPSHGSMIDFRVKNNAKQEIGSLQE
jgi:hypothetical protein